MDISTVAWAILGVMALLGVATLVKAYLRKKREADIRSIRK